MKIPMENILFNAQQKWGIEPSTVMAIIRQESSFKPNAAPDRRKFWELFLGKDLHQQKVMLRL